MTPETVYARPCPGTFVPPNIRLQRTARRAAAEPERERAEGSDGISRTAKNLCYWDNPGRTGHYAQLCPLADPKPVIAGPGTRIAMRDNHLTIDGGALEYVAVAPRDMAAISCDELCPVVEIERGNGPDVYISFGHDGSLGDFEEQVVPAGRYFVLGSNRDASMDSRQLGALQRERILGKIIGRIGSAG